MKKIISAALVGAMVAGAFAVDAKITLNYRSRLEAFAQDTQKNGDTKETTREWLDWQGSGYNGASSDTFKFVLNGDTAGATFAVNLFNNADGKTLTYDSNEGKNIDDAKNDGKSSKAYSFSSLIQLNEYSAWMKFGVGPGTLRFTTGNWKDGYADGNYRVKKDVDAQNAEGIDFERFKLGSILKGSQALTFVDDLANSKGQTATSGFVDYGFNVTDDINLNILVGGTYNGSFDKTKDETKDDVTTSSWKSAFVSRIQFGMKGLLNAEFIYKKWAPRYNTFALYVMPQILDALTLNVGGAMEMYTGKEDYVDWGFDIRARYQVMEPLSITFFTNISGTNLDNGRVISSGIAGTDGKQALQQKFNPNASGKAGQNLAQFKTAMWNNLSAQYKINDTFTASLNLGLITPLAKGKLLTGADDDNSYGPEWRVVPGVKISAASNALIWTGVVLSGSSATIGNSDFTLFNFSVPVIFRVKM